MPECLFKLASRSNSIRIMTQQLNTAPLTVKVHGTSFALIPWHLQPASNSLFTERLNGATVNEMGIHYDVSLSNQSQSGLYYTTYNEG